jgi:hypothetical protein
VRPVKVASTDPSGPTIRQAYGPGWWRTSPGHFVPARVDSTVVEQRILEQSVRLGPKGAITAWAALRWRGAAYFEGVSRGGQDLLPVPLAVGRACVRPDPAIDVVRRQLPLQERETHQGVSCAIAERALFDEIIRLGSVRPAVVAIDMAVAADLVSIPRFAAFLRGIGPRNGVVLAREAAGLARGSSWSPQEPWMRLCWTLDAELPEPRCNVPVFDLTGNLIGVPDLFDEEAGVVGEYQGAVHRDLLQHRRDVVRADRFREHRLEYFEMVGGELYDRETAAARMRTARARALFLPPSERSWTLEPPAWWRERADSTYRTSPPRSGEG